MLATYKSELINFTPREIARYLQDAFPDIDFLKVTEIAFITGVFPNDAYLLTYVKTFLDEMKLISGGRFDPRTHSHQRMKVSSHLLRDEETMKAGRALGIKRFTYTVELVDNMRRALIMDIAKRGGRGPHPVLCPPVLPAQNWTLQQANADSSVVTEDRTRVIVKGSATFERVMSILETACRVFGQNEVEPVLIIGLDTYDDTMRCVRRLHAEGYKMLTRALFNAYDPDQVPLYRMTLPDAIAATEWINAHFSSGYRQVLDLADDYLRRFNPIQ